MVKKVVPDGRFEGDWYLTLKHNPLAKYPWLVSAAEWGRKRVRNEEGQYVWSEPAWYKPHPMGDGPYEGKSFKKAKSAIRYMHKWQKRADLSAVNRYQEKKIDAHWTRVL